jgi:signal transduction histidine kinase
LPPFRARARTVDLLGRQQIAGIPTAISELFKNAHDAYAEHVEADYLRGDPMLILRDDGFGMNPEEFVERWLTLGTDSKVGSKRGLSPPAALAGQPRPVLGEKGIGRLAIASVGPQVLVLTRALRGKRLSDLTVALVNWRLFELPGVNLDELDIPMVVLPGGTLPSRSDVDALAESVRTQLKKLTATKKEADPILADLKLLRFDPGLKLDEPGAPSLGGDGHGTQFLITPTAEELAADIDTRHNKEAPPLVQTLIGFANTMLPNSPKPRIQTAFRDHLTDGTITDLIGPAEFFTPEDFAMADHRVSGRFNELGDFEGSVQVYGGEARAYDFVFTSNRREPIQCGPFPFDLAYVQGESKDSRLAPTEHARVTRKLDEIGGLYIYRDDIRVLPYGTPDFDFLGIERRRTQNLSRAFFSYRRMFGVVQLSSDTNRTLQEKAGREGFIYNTAYRQFRDLLSDMFVDLAAEFFTRRGNRSEDFEGGREEARERYKLRKERDERSQRARERFAREIASAAQGLRNDEPQRIAADALDTFTQAVDAAGGHADAARILQDAEAAAREALDAGRARFSVREPIGFGLTAELRSDWDDLRPALRSLDADVWEPALQNLVAESLRVSSELTGGPDRRERLESALEAAGEAARRRTEQAASELRESEHHLSMRVGDEVEQTRSALTGSVATVLDDAGAAITAGIDSNALADLRVELEERLRRIADERERTLLTLAARIGSVAGSNGTYVDTEAATLEEELLGLRERTGRDLELAQLGMATEILSHELDLTIVALRGALDRLGVRADDDGRLVSVYNDLRTGFDHLDTYLALFTPLQRRLTRRRLLIKGSQIADFLRGLFARRLEDDHIELRVTDAFEAWRGRGFRSTVYPVFVNLVDNATYWTTQQRPPRWVSLDAVDEALIVADSGPGIPERDLDAVWEFGFTRKPGGRGAGLHIARETLSRDGWELTLESTTGKGAVFRLIAPEDVPEDGAK